MGEFINRIRAQATEFLQALDNRQRIIYGLIAGFLIITLALGIFFMARTNYSVLMTNLSLEEAGSITARLDELSIPWKQEANNSTILVPDGNRDKALMELAVGGFTSAGEITWETVMEKTSISMSNDEKNQLYLQAQTTALTRAIKQLDNVDDAILNLHVSTKSNFLIENDDAARASVVLSLKSGTKLTENQVKGIEMIIVNAVKGLEPDRVTITDTTGEQLNQFDTESNDYIMSSQMEMTEVVRSDVRKRIYDFLATIYGKSNVEVSVNVKLDFDSQETEQVMFSPPEGFEEGLVRSMTELSENVVGSTSGGVPGTDTNVETTTYSEESSGTSTYRKANKTLNYELNQINTKISKAKGQIEDITIAVIIDKENLVDQILTEEQRAEVSNLVSAAAGLDPKYVQVSAHEFAPDETITIGPTDGSGLPIPLWLIGVIVGVLIVVVISVVFVMNRRKNDKVAEEEELAIIEQEELEAISTEMEDKSSPKYQIEKFLESNPEAVASLLRSWLNED